LRERERERENVPGLPLGGKVAVAGWDAEEEGVVLCELVGGDERGVWRFALAGGVHLAEDLLGEGFLDPGEKRQRVSGKEMKKSLQWSSSLRSK
jgi:hypothetical protein